jgi:hypothetical protein
MQKYNKFANWELFANFNKDSRGVAARLYQENFVSSYWSFFVRNGLFYRQETRKLARFSITPIFRPEWR